MEKRDTSWSTYWECEFLRGLGSYAKRDRVRRWTRIELLQRYLETMPLRSDWGAIDREQVTDVCIALLGKEQEKIHLERMGHAVAD